MSKNIKRIVAIALAAGTISAVAPATNYNLLTTRAYASSSNSNDTFDSFKLKTSSGSNIKIYDSSSYDDKVDSEDIKPEDEETYFAKTSADTINIEIDGVSSKYVRVFKGTSDSTKGKKVSNDISLSTGNTTTIIVRIYSSEPDDNPRYDDDDDKLNDFKFKVKCTSDSSDSSDNSNDSDSYDDIYLDKLSINGDSISLSDSKITYDYTVDSSTDEATIKAVPPDEDDDNYTVTIDDDQVDSADKFRKKVDLKQGKNQFKVELEDDDDNTRVYTININRGSSSNDVYTTNTTTTTATTKPSTATDITPIKVSQWINVNGNWQYLDATGKTIKNSWIQSYYVKDDGNMATDWLQINGGWYYFGTDGSRKTGWQQIRGAWYYLDGQGKMFIGWMKDINGKYYYLNPDGTMAYSTTIQGYKLGADGAWINK